MLKRLKEWVILTLHGWLEHIAQRAQEIETRHLLQAAGAVGRNVCLKGRVRLTGVENLRLGNNVHLGENAYIRAEGGLTIGDHTHISRNVVIYTVNHRYEGERIPYDDELVKKPVWIGRNVWIGMNVCITPGTRIGDGAIIGMGTTVCGEVPPLGIVAGQKWRIIGYRDRTRYEALDSAGAYGGTNGLPLDDPGLQSARGPALEVSPAPTIRHDRDAHVSLVNEERG
jgi:maltose O-acetyltransferase